jgi:hypothetical protein
VMLHIDQVQTDAGVFTMPIDIVLETAGGDVTVVVWNDQWSQDFFFTVDEEPAGLEFDPDNWILKNLTEGTGVASPGAAASLSLAAAANPFTERATLVYSVPAPTRARIVVYDAAGRLVDVLLDADVDAGAAEVVWNGVAGDGKPVARGIYFARLVTAEGSRAQKLLRLK